MYNQAFKPWPGGTQGLYNAFCAASSTTAVSATKFITQTATVPSQIQIQNTCTTANLWVNFGATSSITTAAVPSSSNIPIVGIPPGCLVAFTIDPSVQYISWILDGSGSTGTIVVNVGEGM